MDAPGGQPAAPHGQQVAIAALCPIRLPRRAQRPLVGLDCLVLVHGSSPYAIRIYEDPPPETRHKKRRHASDNGRYQTRDALPGGHFSVGRDEPISADIAVGLPSSAGDAHNLAPLLKGADGLDDG